MLFGDFIRQKKIHFSGTKYFLRVTNTFMYLQPKRIGEEIIQVDVCEVSLKFLSFKTVYFSWKMWRNFISDPDIDPDKVNNFD